MKKNVLKYGLIGAAIALAITSTGALLLSGPLILSPPPHPHVTPDTTNTNWILLEDMQYEIGNSKITITVPAGFVTDFASIPKPLWSFGLSPHGKYSRAAIIHDYLYWSQVCTKQQADRIMVLAMKESHVDFIDEAAVFRAVDIFGEKSWDDNKTARTSGLPRVVPKQYQDFPANLSWPEYRQLLHKVGIVDPVFTVGPKFCEFGNSTQVPGGVRPKPDHAELFAKLKAIASRPIMLEGGEDIRRVIKE